MQNKNKELDRLNGVYMKLLNNAGVEYIEGRGTVVDAHTVEVNGKRYTVSSPGTLSIITKAALQRFAVLKQCEARRSNCPVQVQNLPCFPFSHCPHCKAHSQS